ncbi:Spliceosome-associated protein 130 B-like protein [Drosera capensis]
MAVTEKESSSSPSSSAAQSRHPSASTAGAAVHFLAKSLVRSGVILQVVRGCFRSPDSSDIVFGKETSIELVIMGDDGIVQSVCEQPVFGMIKDLAVLPWKSKLRQHIEMSRKDLLVVLSDSAKLSFLSFSKEMHRFFAVTHVQLSDVGRMLAVDSSGSFVAVGSYEKQVTLFSMSRSYSDDVVDKRITYPPEVEDAVTRRTQKTCVSGTIWSMCYISDKLSQSSKEHSPILAIVLTRKGSFLNTLLLLRWLVKENSFHVLSQYLEAGPLAFTVVEVPQSFGLALLFRVGDALVMDLNDALRPVCVYRTSLNTPIPIVVEPDGDVEGFIAASALLELQDPRMDTHKDDPMNVDSYLIDYKYIPKYVCSWSWEPGTGNNRRMIFSMDTGEMFMYEISLRSDGLEVYLSDSVHQGLPCKSLLWVEGGFLAAIVEMGDGLVLKLNGGKLEYISTIQNSAPILDMSLVDYHNEKHNQIFACCGVAPEGSLRIIRSGLSVERLVRTASVYQGVTDTWTIRMKLIDPHHSFLVLSFVEQTRVLSVGLSFSDVTDSVGFQSDVCTLACGLLDDGMLVQIHQNAVRLCLPTVVAHSEGVPLPSPVCASWSPNEIGISLGSVTRDLIVLATSNPCFLILLGVKSLSLYHYEVYEMQHVRLQNEASCIYLTQNPVVKKKSTSYFPSDSSYINALPNSGYTFVIGTHKPSVEILSYLPGHGIRVHAVGIISLTSTIGTAVAGCIPQDVRLVLVDRLYVLSGLRNGMLLRFEWPTPSANSSSEFSSHRSSSSPSSVVDAWKFQASSSTGVASWTSSSKKPKDNDPIFLQLIAIRRIGVAPVSLVPLMDCVDTDIIALSERPWLVQTARHSLSYISLSFQPSTHVTTVCSAECPKGLLFVSDNSLHLVEMLQYKSVNVQKFNLEGTPRKVLYHSDSRLLLVMRTDLSNDLSDICCIDPLSGSLLSSFKFELGEIGKCMDLVRVGSELVLVVGTSLSPGPAMMPCGEAEDAKGRLIVLCLERSQNSECGSVSVRSKASSSSRQASPYYEATGYAADQISNASHCSSPDDTSCDGLKLEDGAAWHLRLAFQKIWSGMVLSVCSYLNHYFLASAGNSFYVCGFANDNPQRVRRFASARTRHIVLSLTTNVTRIAVGDGRDGILLYSYHEEAKKLELLYGDPGPGQRLVADCLLMDSDAAVVSDRQGSIAILTCPSEFEDNMQPEGNLTLSCSFYMGEIAMSIRKVNLLEFDLIVSYFCPLCTLNVHFNCFDF